MENEQPKKVFQWYIATTYCDEELDRTFAADEAAAKMRFKHRLGGEALTQWRKDGFLVKVVSI